jgi:serine phosphatase RsbU (regulator of sigma subunit)
MQLLLFIGSLWLSVNGFVTSPQVPGFSVDGSDIIKITADDLTTDEKILFITDRWKYQPGDDLAWAEKDLDDWDWMPISTYLTDVDLAFNQWEGIGWFRLKLDVDSSLVNIPIGLIFDTHHGASEVFHNGIKLFSFGEFSPDPEQYVAYTDSRPRVIYFNEPGIHVISVRYANHDYETFLSMTGYAGFRILLSEWETQLEKSLKTSKDRSLLHYFFLGGLLVFTFIHFLLYAFYPTGSRNLYFAIFTGFLALLAYSLMIAQLSNSPYEAITFFKLGQLAWILTIIYALRFTYSLQKESLPLQFWGFCIVGLILLFHTWYSVNQSLWIRELFVLLSVLEMLRVLIYIFLKRERGAWIIGTGLLFFIGGILFTIAVNLEFIIADAFMGNVIGSTFLIFSMSVYLSRDFAFTQKTLEYKLKEVQHLSEKSLDQERRNKEIELESKLLEAENNRKSHELEEARALQLSMLPKKMPDLQKWDIAVFMETATEVGGDYYDYSITGEDSLTLVIGDATGHGLKAGIMVATAKSYFHTLASELDSLSMLKRMSSGFKNLNLKMMYMGISLLRCNGYKLEFASAGMPPMLWYRSKTKIVEEIVLKGLPLGTRVEFPYKTKKFEVEKGDVLLLMSDGLMELFNNKREMLEIGRIKNTLKESAEFKAGDIVNHLSNLMDQWSGGLNNDDDVTFLVLKVN